MPESIQLRPATLDDARLLFEWRNDPLTVRASHQSRPVVWSDHCDWLARVIADPRRMLYVIVDQQQAGLGTVRAELDQTDHWELSWTIAPAARGRGVAKQGVRALVEGLSGTVRAEVREDNIASARVAEAAGLELVGQQNGILQYQRSRSRHESSIGPE